MSDTPFGSRTRKGAIVALDPAAAAANVIVFQYNPDGLQRTLTPQPGGYGGTSGDPLRLAGPPREALTVDIELDAADVPQTSMTARLGSGVHPQLAALEILVYPRVATVLRNTVLEALGVIEVTAPSSPLTLFVWGPKRVVPVRLAGLSVQEQAHDRDLNPIRAIVSLSMEVLTYADLPATHLGHGLFLAHQVAKEALAAAAGGAGATDAGIAALRSIPLPPRR
jgi:hypothetical protein